MARRITPDTLGAWLLRSNLINRPELPRLVAEGGHRVHRWCVARNYRSAMMAPGDLVVLWVSGDGRRLARGVWGAGSVLGVDGLDSPVRRTASDGGPAGGRDGPTVELDIRLFREPLSDRVLRAAGIDDLEVQVQPQGSNPSWISVGQLSRLRSVDPTLFVERLS